jgi:hypothetical protein
VCRWGTIFFPRYFDVDEALFVAQALTFEHHPIPWHDVDPATSGPLNSYALLWGAPFGLEPSYFVARMTQLFCLMGMMALLYFAGRRIAGDFLARLSILPIFVFLCLTRINDYTNYTSEQLSIFLISWAIYLLIRLRRNPNSLRLLFLFGFVVGMLPFAKLQSSVACLALGFMGCWLLLLRRCGSLKQALTRCGVLGAAMILPGAILLTVVAASGALFDFWESYIEMSRLYGDHYPTLRRDLVERIAAIHQIFEPPLDMAMPTYLLTCINGAVAACLATGCLKATRKVRDWLMMGWFLSAGMVVTVVSTNRTYVHYNFYLLPAFGWTTLASLGIVRTFIRKASWQQLRSFYWQAGAFATLILTGLLFFVFFWVKLFDSDFSYPISSFLFSTTPTIALISALVIAAANVGPTQKIKYHLRNAAVGGGLVFFLIPALLFGFLPGPFLGRIREMPPLALRNMDRAILQIRPPGGRIAIWGWAFEYSAETGTPLGTRDAVTDRCLQPGPLQSYYRQRLLHDLNNNQPELFLEAVGPDNFALNDPELDGIARFPELNQFVTTHYRLAAEIDGMRLFVWNGAGSNLAP